MEQFFQVGVITSTHGIRGEVKVFPTTSDPQRFRKLKEVILASEKERVSLEIQSVRFSKQFVIVRFRGIDDINEVEKYKGRQLLVAREDAVKLEKDEYYIADLLGMDVVTDDGEKGILKDVIETGANEVYVVQFETSGEVLIPAIRDCILDVDVEAGSMRVHLLEGLKE